MDWVSALKCTHTPWSRFFHPSYNNQSCTDVHIKISCHLGYDEQSQYPTSWQASFNIFSGFLICLYLSTADAYKFQRKIINNRRLESKTEIVICLVLQGSRLQTYFSMISVRFCKRIHDLQNHTTSSNSIRSHFTYFPSVTVNAVVDPLIHPLNQQLLKNLHELAF